MIEYKNNSDNNIVEIIVEGKITEADFDQVVSQMKADIEKHGKLRMLEEIRSFEGIDPITLWKDARFGLAHVNDFTHVAVIVEQAWMRTWSQAVDNVLSAKVKAFEPSQIDAAREWLANAPEPSQDSKFEYRNNPNNNIVEITIEGKITEADFDHLLNQAKSDFKKHGKLRILEEVRSFEGIDPMALWKDIQMIPYVKDVTHAAIVADAKWMRTMAEAVSAVIPAEIKAFELSQIQEAREWLLNAPEPNQASKIKYRNNPNNNIVEITIEGKITAADFDKIIAQLKADFKKHEKLCILEEIRSFEGIDPMALWQDIRFGLPHVNDIARVAVVTDTKWIQTFSEAIDNILPAQVKAFELSQIEAARKWLADS